MKLKNLIIYIITLFTANITLAQSSVEQTSLLLDGVREYKEANYTKAKEHFNKLLEINPESDAAYYYLANIALANEDLTLGELYLDKCLSLDSTNFWYADLQAQILLYNKKVPQAIAVYEKMLSMYPKKSNIYYSLVNLYMNNKDVEKTKQMLVKIEQLQGKSEALAMTYFNLYRSQSNWDGALKYLVEFDKEFQSARVESIIGDLYANRFNDSLAIHYYNKALSLDHQYAPAICGKAEVYRQAGDYPTFFSTVEPFIANEQYPSKVKSEYMIQLIQSGAFAGKYRSPMDSLVLSFEKTHAKDTTALYFVAAYFGQGGDAHKCLKTLRKAHYLYPDNPSAMFQYITYLYSLNQWEELEKEVARVSETFKGNTDLIQLDAIAKWKREKYSESIQAYNKLENIALERKDTALLAQSYASKGDIYYTIKDFKKCYSEYKKALKYKPTDPALLNNYAYYLCTEGKNLKLAYQMSEQSIKAEPDNPTYLDTFGWILYLLDKPLEAKAQFKHAMLFGGKENATILDHYAEVLFALKEYDLAFIYWDKAASLEPELGIEEKVKLRKQQIKK
ncbi:MAG: tetratricopeptide repeat protein [Bacteroidia bacterium]|nr:tetratricopeptide repeat protein [Bacteroidia bacterium]